MPLSDDPKGAFLLWIQLTSNRQASDFNGGIDLFRREKVL
jgi:hypothetical protein